MVTTAAYGSWASPISVDDLTGASVGLDAPRIDGNDLYWLESHADQGGRVSLWRAPLAGGDPVEVSPGGVNVRTRVNEYGGGEYGVDRGVVVFSDFDDGRLYVTDGAGSNRPLTAADAGRYGDVAVHAERGLALAVREDHRRQTLAEHGEAVTSIVAVPLDGSAAAAWDKVAVLVDGADFYSSPALSGDDRLAFVSWNHPDMPWDSTVVSVGRLAGRLGEPGDPLRVDDAQPVAGGPGESAVQPRWCGDGLVFASDRTDFWNLYLFRDEAVRVLHETEAEFAGPQWVLGQTPYVVLDQARLLCSITRSGADELAVLDVASGALTVAAPAGVGARALAAGPAGMAAVLTRPDRPATLSRWTTGLPDPADPEQEWTMVRSSSTIRLDPAMVSVAQALSWPGEGGDVHGWYYAPRHPDFAAPAGTLPPLITVSHGGPTSQSGSAYALALQYWTTRGYAVLDVNYGGSTGYGRAYRNRLAGRWGIVDVADCANGAAAMGTRGLADPDRLVVKGGSAGGYTTLRALTATDVFAAGISQYGVADLEILVRDTHKFESRYLNGLVGPYPGDRQTYLDRSPLYHLDRLSAPILLLQGLDDKVVPPNQAELMADAARAKGLPVALLMFAGEGHGFRRAETIRASLEAQQSFLGQVFGFTPADDLAPLDVDNLA